ncbi:hypothetical protein M0813_07801 [Anaeramoeba flamelloides]|uniref:Rap-GAP domain-containing protein n=1 Tax=Anaeramoeba flamelloides TaxID=1746091 RepID=A0ABQ8XA61_9EUKA|nr:hypothetical protein M0813_07801 [Anaeramoeba flamelloides]
MINENYENEVSLKFNQKFGVLKKFPLGVQVTVTDQILQILEDPNKPPGICFSEFAIEWVLECSGNAFSLPLENHQIIEKAILLYDKWIQGVSLSETFVKNRSHYLCAIFGHFSSLFTIQGGVSNNLAKVHFNLCLKVIQAINNLMTQPKEILDQASWKYLIKRLIQICNLIMADNSTNEQVLKQNLPPHLLRLLFNILLKSGIVDIDLWRQLKLVIKTWTNRKETIIQWSATTFGLINRLIYSLTKSKEGTKDLIILIPPTNEVQFEASTIVIDGRLQFLFKQTLNLIGNPNEIPDPEIFLIAIQGIQSYVTLFLQNEKKTNNSGNKLINKINGNTLLNLFGNWLFEAIQLQKEGFEEGIEVIYDILCNIFMNPQDTAFNAKNLTAFYHSLIIVFEHSNLNLKLLNTILKKTKRIFISELEGVYILVPYYFNIIKRILTGNEFINNESVRIEILRSSCLAILNTLICLPLHFPTMKFKPLISNSKVYKETEGFTFLDLRSQIYEIIIDCIKNEQDANNYNLLMWCLIIFIQETYKEEKQEFDISIIINSFNEILCQPNSDQLRWPTSVYDSIFFCLKIFGDFFHQLGNKELQLFEDLCINLIERVKILIETPSIINDNTKLESLAIRYIDVIIHTIQPLINNNSHQIEKINKIKLIIENLLKKNSNLKKKKSKKNGFKSVPIEKSLNILFQNLQTQQTDKINNDNNNHDVINEDKIRFKYNLNQKQFNQKIRYGSIKKKNLIGFFENSSPNKNKLLVLIRNLNGSNCWELKYPLKSLDENENENENENLYNEAIYLPTTENNNNINSNLKEKKILYDCQIDNDTLIDQDKTLINKCFINLIDVQNRIEINKKINNEIFNKKTYPNINKLSRNENSHLDKKNKNININNQLNKNTLNSNNNTFDLNNSGSSNIENFPILRLLLSNLGLIRLDSKEKFSFCEKRENLITEINNLDSITTKPTHTIAIIYISKELCRESDENKIFTNKVGSKKYIQFLKGLGNFIDLKKHKGFFGGLNYQKTGRIAPYYKDSKNEIIYHASTMLRFKKNSLLETKSILANNQVTIIWLEDNKIWKPNHLRSKQNLVYIIIRPHYTGLYHFEIINFSSNNFLVFPLGNHSFISWNILPQLIRKIAIYINQELKNENNLSLDPKEIREKKLLQIQNSKKTLNNSEEFYTSFFLQNSQLD